VKVLPCVLRSSLISTATFLRLKRFLARMTVPRTDLAGSGAARLVEELRRDCANKEGRAGDGEMVVVKLHEIPGLVADTDQAAGLIAKGVHRRDVSSSKSCRNLAESPVNARINVHEIRQFLRYRLQGIF
jgi:hypothetical protein